MKLKDYLKFFKENSSIKDLILIILSVISIIIWISGTVFASDGDISWSSNNQAITDEQFKNIISENMNIDVTNEDFSTYTFSSSSFKYNTDILNNLNNVNVSKAFLNYDNKLYLAFGTTGIFQLYYFNYSNSSLPKYYYFNNTGWVFDFENKTIEYKSTTSFPWSDLGWYLSTANVSQTEFETTAFKRNMIYDTFFLVLGPIYDNLNTSEILNYVKSFKIDGNLYENEQFMGEIVFSEEFESWQTRNLSENFYNSGDTFTYYVHGLDYSESGISSDSSFKVKISDVIFESDSIYLPTINQVNNAIKQAEGYMNYAYVITLTINDVLLLRSDVFIVDAKPIVMIPHFKQKYDYIYYGSYIDIVDSSGDVSGDVGGVITPSGDDTTLEGGISGIWQAIVNLPENLLNGLIRLFIPPSDYFYNEDVENLGLWQRMSVYFQSKLGFLYDVIVFIPNLVTTFIDIIGSFTEEWSIQVPDLTLPALTGVEEFTFFKGFEWSPYDWVNSREEFRSAYDLYLNIMDLFIYWSLVWLAVDTLFGFLKINQITYDEFDENDGND